MDKTKFGSYVKESRIKKNYTQQELADLLFVDVSTVSKWERGVSYPDITLVPDICRILEISEHELIASSHDIEYRKMKKDATKYNNMKKSVFWSINIVYLTAILTCFIVNIAVNHTLSWFFIVLTSILCAYTFCPTITWLFPRYKKIVFSASTFVSMLFLFLTCSVYTNNYWFFIAILGVLLAYYIVIYPVIFKKQKNYLNEEKYKKLSKWFLLSYITGIAVITFFLLVAIYMYTSINLKMSLLITGGIFVIPMLFGILNLFEISKKLNKPILLSLVGVFVVLVMIGIGRSIYLKSSEVTKTYSIEQTYNNIKIEGKTFDLNIYTSSNDETKIIYTETKKVSFEIKVIDGVLTVNQNDNRKFYDKLFNFSDYEVELYISQKVIDSLTVKGSIGDIEVNKGVSFNNVDIINSMGDIDFNSNVTNNLIINNSTGDIEIENSKIGGTLSIKTKTGDVELNNVNCNKLDIKITTGDVELHNSIVTTDFVHVGSTGDVQFNDFDANNIDVSVSTGDVKGTLKSNKIFIAKSKTGAINVPETTIGGICKITTSTGSIKIRYK